MTNTMKVPAKVSAKLGKKNKGRKLCAEAAKKGPIFRILRADICRNY